MNQGQDVEAGVAVPAPGFRRLVRRDLVTAAVDRGVAVHTRHRRATPRPQHHRSRCRRPPAIFCFFLLCFRLCLAATASSSSSLSSLSSMLSSSSSPSSSSSSSSNSPPKTGAAGSAQTVHTKSLYSSLSRSLPELPRSKVRVRVARRRREQALREGRPLQQYPQA